MQSHLNMTTTKGGGFKDYNRKELIAKQVSNRGGILHCRYLDDRVEIGGKALPYLIGEVTF